MLLLALTRCRDGCALGDAAAGAPTHDVDQQHVRVLFQKVLLRGVDDAPGPGHHPSVHTEKRRQGR